MGPASYGLFTAVVGQAPQWVKPGHCSLVLLTVLRGTPGLWAWARYPNYGGEISLWWGIWILCTPVLSKGYWATVASPLFVMLLILKGSGVPLQEKQVREMNTGLRPYGVHRLGLGFGVGSVRLGLGYSRRATGREAGAICSMSSRYSHRTLSCLILFLEPFQGDSCVMYQSGAGA